MSSSFRLAALAGLAACGGPAPDSFIALQADFADFRSWDSEVVGTDEVGVVGSPHVGGARTVFYNQLPHRGASSFPVGTMFVKTIPSSTVEGGTDIHAMVKRAEDYNPDGAVGWEWFELAETAGSVGIAWRGPSPASADAYRPPGDTDTSSTAGDCNVCHAAAESNDYIMGAAFDLKSL